MATVKRFTNQAPLLDIISALEEDGCAVIENAIDNDSVRSLREEIKPHLEQTANCHGNFYGYVTKRLSGLMAKSAISREMAVNETLLGIMDEFLLRSCREYQLNLTQAIEIGPGEPQQIIHRDDLMFPYNKEGKEAMINCMWAVDDFTNENGATHIVPGSHKWEDPERLPTEDEIIQATMKSGSVLIYLGSLIHGGGANKSQKSRTGLVISYSLGWLKQAENQFLSVPIDLAATFPERLQRLMGYFVHSPNLGCVEGQNPLEILKGKSIKNCGFVEFLPEEVLPLIEEYRNEIIKAA